MTDRLTRTVSASLVLALAALMILPASTMAAAPATSLSVSPASPDGSHGWWRTPAEAFATAAQNAVVHYDWGSGEMTVAAAAGVQESLGFAPEGLVTLTAYAVNSADETGPVVSAFLRTDSMPPSQPGGLVASHEAGNLALRWLPSTDTTSGLAYYTLYRNLSGPPFAAGDAIASVTETGAVDDPGPGIWYYGVRATDQAGNDSLMSEAVRASADVTPPSLPGDLAAWRNGAGFIRVSWRGSIDLGTGVSHYTVVRSIGGAAALVLGTVPAGTDFFDDTDAEAYAAGDVRYRVSVADRIGNEATAGPVLAGTDLVPPSVPAPPVVRSVPALDGSLQRLGTGAAATFSDSQDADSGVLRYELLYGPDSAAPSTSVYFPRPCTTDVRSSAERSDMFFRLRAEDRAGNVSAMSAATEQRAITVDRIAGPDRVRTSLAVAAAGFPTSHDVVFASAFSFPDALAASALAGALDAPVVLVGAGPLPSGTLATLTWMDAVDGWVVGGEPAVSRATFASIATALPGTTTRVAGTDRYRTAAAVASAVTSIAGTPQRVFVVSGVNFPDALSVGPAAYASASPVLFATPAGIPQPTLDALRASGATQTVIVGGTSAVWPGAEGALPAPSRISGTDRYATSRAFADWAVRDGVLSADRPLLVTGASFPDGLSAAPLAGIRRSPVLLVRRYTLDQARPFLGAHLADVLRATAIGGETVVDYSVMLEAWSLFTLPAR
ncbi:MAG TPA: cell wall-binding repeat-containing protein [Coriobacteriia bacterium]|jgi:putative cell wall-binding protein